MNERSERRNDAADALEALLSEREVYLPDDGFTARVMGRLPPRSRAGSLRGLILAAGLLAGVVVLVSQAGTAEAILAALLEHARNRDLVALLRLTPVVAAIGSAIWAWSSLGCEEA